MDDYRRKKMQFPEENRQADEMSVSLLEQERESTKFIHHDGHRAKARTVTKEVKEKREREKEKNEEACSVVNCSEQTETRRRQGFW